MTQAALPLNAPPKTQTEMIDWIRLIRSRRVGPATFHRLLAEHGTATAALAALPEVAAKAGVPKYKICPINIAEAELSQAQRLGLHPIWHGTPAYPPLLMETPDAPAFLWAKGKTSVLRKPSIAIIGARNASSLGTRMTYLLAEQLSEAGYTVVSGLARGIDASAHKASLKKGTIAVMAGGVDVVYPKENAQLYQDIPENGVIVSEQPAGLAPQARNFPIRNRIVAGMTQATIVMEAAARSGSLITARQALDIGRDVMAVPGHPFDGRAAGCNFLLRDGATLVRSAKDVIEALSPIPETSLRATPAVSPAITVDTTALKPKSNRLVSDAILELLGASAVPEDVVIRDSGLPACTVSRSLVDLELQGRIERQPGGLLSKAN